MRLSTYYVLVIKTTQKMNESQKRKCLMKNDLFIAIYPQLCFIKNFFAKHIKNYEKIDFPEFHLYICSSCTTKFLWPHQNYKVFHFDSRNN